MAKSKKVSAKKAPAKTPGIPSWNPQMKGSGKTMPQSGGPKMPSGTIIKFKGPKPDKIEKKFPDSKFPPRKKKGK